MNDVIAIREQMARDRAEQFARALFGTPGGAAQARDLAQVAADEAGEVYMQAADGIIAHLRASGSLTNRQCDAAAVLARLWGLGGGRTPWRTTGGGGDRDESAVAAARREYNELLRAVRTAIRPAMDTLSMGEWVAAYNPIPVWAEGCDAVADRLGLAR